MCGTSVGIVSEGRGKRSLGLVLVTLSGTSVGRQTLSGTSVGIVYALWD